MSDTVGIQHTVRSEWIKLRTTRTTLVLVLVAVGFEALIVGLTSVFASTGRSATYDLLSAVLGAGLFVGLLLGVVGALSITSEHAHGTIRPTFAATPRRSRVYTAKFVTITVATLLGAILVIGVATALGWTVFASRGADIDIANEPNGTSALLGAVLFIVILSWLGFALGLLTRSSPLAIVLLVLWPLVLEPLVAGLLWVSGAEGLVRWLPYSAGFSLGSLDVQDDALDRWAGGAYFGAFVVALVVVGAVVNRQRDA